MCGFFFVHHHHRLLWLHFQNNKRQPSSIGLLPFLLTTRPALLKLSSLSTSWPLWIQLPCGCTSWNCCLSNATKRWVSHINMSMKIFSHSTKAYSTIHQINSSVFLTDSGAWYQAEFAEWTKSGGGESHITFLYLIEADWKRSYQNGISITGFCHNTSWITYRTLDAVHFFVSLKSVTWSLVRHY